MPEPDLLLGHAYALDSRDSPQGMSVPSRVDEPVHLHRLLSALDEEGLEGLCSHSIVHLGVSTGAEEYVATRSVGLKSRRHVDRVANCGVVHQALSTDIPNHGWSGVHPDAVVHLDYRVVREHLQCTLH